jgi:RNA polymerase sigma factor (sigma-70 family)
MSVDDDVSLFRKDPVAVIIRYQPAIRQFVRRYVLLGSLPEADAQDVQQSITEKLLRQAPLLASSFQGKSLLSTYLYAVVRNMLRKEYLERARSPEQVPFHENLHHRETAIEAKLDLELQYRRFRAVLGLLPRRRAKITLGLKLFSGYPIEGKDVLGAYPHCTGSKLLSFLRLFGNGTGGREDLEVFRVAGELIADIERKENSPDAFRRWMDIRIDEILTILNGDPPVYHFDRETLKDFLGHFFSYEGRK